MHNICVHTLALYLFECCGVTRGVAVVVVNVCARFHVVICVSTLKSVPYPPQKRTVHYLSYATGFLVRSHPSEINAPPAWATCRPW
ncbi:hypothetical protein PF010_g12045 [Phytophthora fragariae]|uniref:Secreted protein n=1 Tax=Phytophthora fragariae TaxID=53985 RepID=A0A6A3JWJ8_9STRA|nr:hypothetical protein PF011_g15188 [Phytophthora fragariae]KAE9108071.1 hypothetical protein PF010_g12045 [Phytophthora fragariae]KAE9213829.1 hypothetical protein PF004_g15218 [Phytophthora fragariae]